MMSKTNYFTIIDSKKVTLTKNIITRHGGILGLCAMVLSSPYNISSYISDALIFLCKHSNDRHMIQKSIHQCLSEFRRTHYDSWHKHQRSFTKDQLLILTDTFVSHSYYV
ncbi:unnamed protein product [Rotaria sp. Silwood1]|nr:unnamed protein product [Rotaria sp. Silwood1]CAF5138527.1 unnamed protein product [Rotaria sp. Silwood1]